MTTRKILAPFTFPRTGITVPNRTVLAAMTNKQSNEDGTLSDEEISWLLRRAAGGFALGLTLPTSDHRCICWCRTASKPPANGDAGFGDGTEHNRFGLALDHAVDCLILDDYFFFLVEVSLQIEYELFLTFGHSIWLHCEVRSITNLQRGVFTFGHFI